MLSDRQSLGVLSQHVAVIRSTAVLTSVCETRRRQRAPSPILATSPRINANDVAFVDPVPDVFSPTGRAAAGTPQGGGGEVRFRQEV